MQTSWGCTPSAVKYNLPRIYNKNKFLPSFREGNIVTFIFCKKIGLPLGEADPVLLNKPTLNVQITNRSFGVHWSHIHDRARR